MDVEETQTEKGAVDTDMLLNDNVQAEGTAVTEQQEAQNTGEGVSEEADSMQVNQSISGNVEKGVEEDMAMGGEENKTGDLDIESMLAAIHNDTPPTVDADSQNIV